MAKIGKGRRVTTADGAKGKVVAVDDATGHLDIAFDPTTAHPRGRRAWHRPDDVTPPAEAKTTDSGDSDDSAGTGGGTA